MPIIRHPNANEDSAVDEGQSELTRKSMMTHRQGDFRPKVTRPESCTHLMRVLQEAPKQPPRLRLGAGAVLTLYTVWLFTY